MYPKFNAIFSKIYPTHLRSVDNPTGMIRAILYREMFHMLPAKFQPYRSGGSGEEVVWMILPYMGMAAISNFRSWLFIYILYNHHINANYEISLKLAR